MIQNEQKLIIIASLQKIVPMKTVTNNINIALIIAGLLIAFNRCSEHSKQIDSKQILQDKLEHQQNNLEVYLEQIYTAGIKKIKNIFHIKMNPTALFYIIN